MNRVRIALFSLSGTGNTFMVSSMLKTHFEDLDVETDEFRIEDYTTGETIPDISDYAFIGIGYPVHAFSAPPPVHWFISALPKVEDKKFFIFKTSGEPFRPNNASSCALVRKLKRKGYDFVFERHFLMPYNIMFRYPDPLVKQMVQMNEPLSKGMVKCIISGDRKYIKTTIHHRVFAVILRYIKDYGVKLNGKAFHANKTCTMCMVCAKNCPQKNIYRKNNKIKFGWRCILCMRCVMLCPESAISIGILTPWVLHGPYEFDRIMEDKSISNSHVNENTKGYFKLFRKYYAWANRTIEDELRED